MKIHFWAAALGVLAAALLVVGVIISGNTPSGDATAREWVEYIEDDAALTLIRAYVFIVAGLCLVGLYALGVEPRITGAGTSDRALARLGAIAAVLVAGALSFAGLIGAAVGAGNMFGDVPIDPRVAALFDNFMYGGLLVGSALPAAVMMIVVAVQAQRRKAFGVWVVILSAISALGMAFALIFLPFVLLPIWLIGMSIAVAMAGDVEASPATA